VTDNHLTPSRVVQIVEDSRIEIHELAHIERCASCNDWLRAFFALGSKRHTVPQGIPREPPWLENFRTWCSTIRT